MRINKEYLMEHEPDLVEALWEEGRQEVAADPVTDESRLDAELVATIESRAAEAARAQAREETEAEAYGRGRKEAAEILALPAKGFEDLRAELAADPEVKKGDAALRILNAQSERTKQKGQAELDALKKDEEDLEAPKAGATPDDDENSISVQTAKILNAGKRPEPTAH